MNACGNNFEVAKWIYSLGSVNIHAQNDKAFQMACLYGRFDSYYEVGQSKINIHAQQNKAFLFAIESGNINLV
jgi:hypothetical protein